MEIKWMKEDLGWIKYIDGLDGKPNRLGYYILKKRPKTPAEKNNKKLSKNDYVLVPHWKPKYYDKKI